jgi:gliding motility-associated lipoprotein GldH
MVYYKNILRFQALLLFVLFAAAGFLSTSCNNNVMHSESIHLKNNSWKASDTLFYTFNSKDTLSKYDFYFEIRNTTDYDMQNLYLFITAYYPGDT